MMQKIFALRLALAAVVLALGCPAHAQNPTALQTLQLSTFAGVSPVFTGLGGGRNLSFTAGVDLAVHPYRGLRPTLEVRGTYPMDSGNVDSQKDILGGLRVDYPIGHRFHPYGDFLFGRGEMKYGAGYFFNNFEYVLTTTYVDSPGAGVDFDLTPHFGVKLDAQFQRWSAVPTPSGTIWNKAATAALIYRFQFKPYRGH